MPVMVLHHRESNRMLVSDSMYSNNKQLLRPHLTMLAMMMNMEYLLVLLKHKKMLDRMVKLMMSDTDQVLFENLKYKQKNRTWNVYTFSFFSVNEVTLFMFCIFW